LNLKVTRHGHEFCSSWIELGYLTHKALEKTNSLL